MNFKEYIETHRKAVYDKICEYIPITEPKEHYEMVRDYIDRQGSYRRPGLVMLAGQMFGASVGELLLPAAAQQLSEDWILVVDDAQDDSELRRGKPALHRIHGWVHSVDASMTGHMVMWKMLKDYIAQVGIERGGRLYDRFFDMIKYTVEGQYVENTFIHDTKDLKRASEDLYFKIVDSKTCFYTVYGPMQLGAIAAGQPDNVLDALKEIGTYAGIAFQITDDVLDLIGDEKVFGKKNRGDLYEGKLTLMVLHAYRSATPEEKERMDSIYRKRRQEKSAEEIQFIVDMIDKYRGLDYAKGVAEQYGQKAKAAIDRHRSLLPDNDYARIMISAMEELYVRKK
ncbi:MAG: polyprenyl synthetase family protein [Candidatus Micrarchaeota archaeon]|nr:polyprenyl synthetase family protein [Candidatus Micrarchaeota archaeon]